MAFKDLFSAGAISASGMSAERLRMEVIANNIANATSTRGGPDGGPYRRQEVLFSSVLEQVSGAKGSEGVRLKGVDAEIVSDPSELPKVFMPGHPDADRDGYVTLPNVHLPIEMVNLLTASRAYEANVRTAQTFRQMNEQALILIRGL